MAGLHDILKAYVDNGSVPGAVGLVARGDRMEVATVGAMAVGGAPMVRDSIFRFASITKPITAAAVMMLVQDGRIDVVPAARPITFFDLLSSCAGYGFPSDFALPAVQRLVSVQKDGREPQVSPHRMCG